MALVRPLLMASMLLVATFAAGCTSEPPETAPQADDALAVSRGAWNVTAGERMSIPVLLSGASTQMGGVVRIVAEGVTGEIQVPPSVGAGRVLFVPVDVAADAEPGVRYLKAQWLAPAGGLVRELPNAGELHVRAPTAGGFGPGDAALLMYTAVTQDGRVVSTNDALLRNWPLPTEGPLGAVHKRGFLLVEVFHHDDDGHDHSQDDDHGHDDERDHDDVDDGHEDDVAPWARQMQQLPGLLAGIVGMRTGDARTFTVAPDDAFGERTSILQMARTESVPRMHEIRVESEFIDPASFAEHVSQTSQGDAADYAVGDVFHIERSGEAWPHRIVAMDETTVEYRLALNVGDAYTLHPQWPARSIVSEANETRIVLVTTPTLDVPFTMREEWPGMSVVASMDDDLIVVRHDVPLGHVYEDASDGGPLREHHVIARDDETLSVSSPSPHPLAGESLVLHVIMVRHTLDGAGHTTHGHSH